MYIGLNDIIYVFNPDSGNRIHIPEAEASTITIINFIQYLKTQIFHSLAFLLITFRYYN